MYRPDIDDVYALAYSVILLCPPHTLRECVGPPRINFADYASLVEYMGRNAGDESFDVFLVKRSERLGAMVLRAEGEGHTYSV